MKYLYILESHDSGHFYVGITDDLRARLAKHNAGEVPPGYRLLLQHRIEPVAQRDEVVLHRR